jgi:WD40-like Beta Propeller Repeat
VRGDPAVREAERRLRRLPDRPAPREAEAGDRAWRVVEAAYSERPPGAPPRRVGLRLALAAAIVAVGLAAALTPAGAKVGDWLGERLSSDADTALPAFAGLPKGGEVLAVSGDGAWVVYPDGDLQRVGSFAQAGWSPHGRHVVGVRGRRLEAVTPTGTLKWAVARPRAVHHPAWSRGDGYRVAYLEGGTLRVVAGDATKGSDHRVRRGVAPVTPAWRTGYVLTYAGAGGKIETLNVDSRRRLWVRRVADRPTALAWSRDGKRLVVLSASGLSVYDRGGRLVLVKRLRGARALALHPSGRRAAVTVADRAGTRVVAVRLTAEGQPQPLFAGPGRVQGIAWSPDGSRLLVARRDADQWLLLGPGGRVRALSGVSGELGAGAAFPRVAGWCCSGK